MNILRTIAGAVLLYTLATTSSFAQNTLQYSEAYVLNQRTNFLGKLVERGEDPRSDRRFESVCRLKSDWSAHVREYEITSGIINESSRPDLLAFLNQIASGIVEPSLLEKA